MRSSSVPMEARRERAFVVSEGNRPTPQTCYGMGQGWDNRRFTSTVRQIERSRQDKNGSIMRFTGL
jgi:hypothetical protein